MTSLRVLSILALVLGASACGSDTGTTADGAPVIAPDAPVPDVAVPDAPAPDAAPPDAADPANCSTVAQSCSSGEKCTITPGSGQGHGCVAVSGHQQIGQACTSGAHFQDDCDVGLVCDDSNVCAKLCRAAADCSANQACRQFDTGSDGVCETTCTPFDDSTCPSGFTCDLALASGGASVLLYCRATGASGLGQTCVPGGTDCGASQTCVDSTTFKCVPLCDATHPCATGTCHLVATTPAAGACF